MSNCKRSDAAVAYVTIASGAPALLVGVAWGWGPVAGRPTRLVFHGIKWVDPPHTHHKESPEELPINEINYYYYYYYYYY